MTFRGFLHEFGLSVRGLAQDVLWSSSYSRIYFIVVFENYLQLVWLALGKFWEKNTTLYGLEVVSTVLLICESVLKAIAQGGPRFIAQPLNVIDLIVIGLSVPVLIAAPLISRSLGVQSTLDVISVCIRLCLQQTRLLCVLKKFVLCSSDAGSIVSSSLCVCFLPVNIPILMPSLLSPSASPGLMTVPSLPSTAAILSALRRLTLSVRASYDPLLCPPRLQSPLQQ